MSCGYDFGAPAGEGYEPPFAFTGTIRSVTFDVSGELITDDGAETARLRRSTATIWVSNLDVADHVQLP